MAGIEHKRCGAIMDETRLRFWIDLTALDQHEIPRQPRHAVAVDAAKIGPDQSLRHGGRVTVAGAMGDERVADKAQQLVVANPVGAHARTVRIMI
jgi:hypothetical protein